MADSDDSAYKEDDEPSLSDMEMEETNILDIETEEIKSDNFDFDGENKSLSQELLEGEELSDFGYQMPEEEEEEEKDEEEENDKSPEIKIEGKGENNPDGASSEDQAEKQSENSSEDRDENSLPKDSSDDFNSPDDDYRQDEDDYESLEDEEPDPRNRYPERRNDRMDQRREDPYQNPYRDINPQELREMTEKLEMAQESAMKAMKAAEKAWDAAQKAADSASAVDNAGDYINQLTEDAARKLQNVSDDLKSEIKKEAESNPEETFEDSTAETQIEGNAGLEEDQAWSEENTTGNDDSLSIDNSQNDSREENPEDEILSEGEVNEDSSAFTGEGESETLNENELADVLSMCSPDAQQGQTEEGQAEEEAEESAEMEDCLTEEKTEDAEMTEEENAGDISAENESYEKVLGEVSKLLPYIENILQNKEDAKRFKQEVSLFNQLKEMGALLPEDKRRNFMTSRIRITLDFLIARLSGKPGLLKTTASLRQSGVLAEEEKASTEEVQLSNLNLVKKVIGDMKLLTQDLGDRELAEGLVKMAEETEEKLFKTE